MIFMYMYAYACVFVCGCIYINVHSLKRKMESFRNTEPYVSSLFTSLTRMRIQWNEEAGSSSAPPSTSVKGQSSSALSLKEVAGYKDVHASDCVFAYTPGNDAFVTAGQVQHVIYTHMYAIYAHIY